MTIEEMAGKSDAELQALLGIDKKVKAFREALEEAKGLKPEGRKAVEDRLERMLTPNVYPEDLKYAIEQAKRAEQKGSAGAKAAMQDCCPCSCLD